MDSPSKTKYLVKVNLYAYSEYYPLPLRLHVYFSFEVKQPSLLG